MTATVSQNLSESTLLELKKLSSKTDQLALLTNYFEIPSNTAPSEFLAREAHYQLAQHSYNTIYARFSHVKEFIFMNHGIPHDNSINSDFKILDNTDCIWESQIALYSYVYSLARKHSPVDTPRLLDVGCGRGGGLSTLKKYTDMDELYGCDLNPHHIKFCKSQFEDTGIKFIIERADCPQANFPFVDVVVNVESCHAYYDVPQFLKNIYNTIPTNGIVVLTDVRETGYTEGLLLENLVSSPFDIVDLHDITKLVCKSCADTIVDYGFDKLDVNLGEFLRDKAAQKYHAYATGGLRYVVAVLRKR